MRHIRPAICLVALAITAVARPADPPADAAAVNRLLGRGVNLGNGLEAPTEGAWGFRIRAEYLPLIKQAGFAHVRIPIRWSAHAAQEPPYAIDPALFARVDQVLDQALAAGLAAVVNCHHYDELDKDPDRHLPRLAGLWKQIAERYKDRPQRVVFELYNEPHDKLTDERWQQGFPEVLAAVRASNPRRAVVVGPGHWNNVNNLDKLTLPADDPMLIATFHYYNPFDFTHQGAEWVQNSARWKGKKWEGTPKEVEALRKDFAKAAAWAEKHKRPMYLGEFGAYSAADMESRARWTRAVAREAERLGMSWAYWEFGSGFGVYDPQARAWRDPLLRALTDRQP
jgi:endoglucanase